MTKLDQHSNWELLHIEEYIIDIIASMDGSASAGLESHLANLAKRPIFF